MASPGTFTVEDLARIEDKSARYDLIRGELIRSELAGFRNGVIAAAIGGELLAFAERERLGVVVGAGTGFQFGLDTVLGPDAAFVRTDRLPPRSEWDGFARMAPDLAVEIVSPSDRATYVMDKTMEYLNAGVRLLWILEPRRRIVIMLRADRSGRLLTESDTLNGEDVLPGFSLPVAEVFAD